MFLFIVIVEFLNLRVGWGGDGLLGKEVEVLVFVCFFWVMWGVFGRFLFFSFGFVFGIVRIWRKFFVCVVVWFYCFC